MTKEWQVRFRVNGNSVMVSVPPMTSLAEILRQQLGLTGTKIGCNNGECGACTVIMNGKAVASCLVLAPQVAGADIRTIEGVGGDKALHPIQQAFLDEGAVQCGYCTPGMVMSAVALLEENPNPGEAEVKDAISGNLCRCTGYQKIIRAIRHYAAGR
ncbi:MAG: (2Fe-2S)-binding protein [Anaerolineae bacterium]|nr:(2Fe-2S)-binding protein [Anaerolineae bacterium]